MKLKEAPASDAIEANDDHWGSPSVIAHGDTGWKLLLTPCALRECAGDFVHCEVLASCT